MGFKTVLIAMLCMAIPYFAYTQEEERIEETLLEQIQEELGEGVDISEVSEKLFFYLKKPLDLNTATEQELSDLFFLSPLHIANLLYHRTTSGLFVSLLELQAIEGFDAQLIARVLPFVTVAPAKPFKDLTLRKIMDKDEGSLMLRYGRNLETGKGYDIVDESKSRYLGDPNRYAVRYRWNYDNQIRIAINMEKDAGEPFFKEKQKYGFDFYSGHLEVRDVNSYLKKVVIGDYALQFGQGLVSWNGLAFGKGAWVGSVAKQGKGLVPYSSMNENNFQRGIAAVMTKGMFEWTPFVAYNKLSGNVITLDGDRNIASVSVSGLHRTPTELTNRKTIGQVVYGTNINYRNKRLKVGATYMGIDYDGFRLRGNDIRQKFDFEGRSLHAVSGYYNYSFKNYYFFGETAHSLGTGWANNHGVIASLHSKLSIFANYRNYQRNYHTVYGQSLGEGSNLANEKGVYTGIVFHPSRKIEWINYVDFFSFPWLRYRVDAPSSGADVLSQFTYTWYKVGKLTFRYRYRLKQENQSITNRNSNLIADVSRNQYRVDFQYKLSDVWRIRSRAEMMQFKKEYAIESNGFLIFQDVFWQWRAARLQLNVRLALFNTDDYDSRLYAYENDVLYASSFPMYYDKGGRTYLNIRWKIRRNVDLWTRYALTYYFEREEVGSGLDLVAGNKKSDFKLQLRWQW